MTIVFDMVSGQFLDEKSGTQTEQQHSYETAHHEELALRLETVENSGNQKKTDLPADLAYQTFLLTG